MQNTYKVGEALVRGRRRNQETAMSAGSTAATGEAVQPVSETTTAQEPTVAAIEEPVAPEQSNLPTVATMLAPLDGLQGGGSRDLGITADGVDLTVQVDGGKRSVSLKADKISLTGSWKA